MRFPIVLPSLITGLLVAVATGCSTIMSPFQSEKEVHPFKVFLAHNDVAHRFTWLIKDMEMEFQILTREDTPFSSPGHTALWVGNRVPANKAANIIHLSRRYYPDIRYIAYTSERFPEEPEKEAHIYVGMATGEALKLGLKDWNEKDFSSLKEIETEDELNRLIKSKYGPKRTISDEDQEQSLFLRILPWNWSF